MTVPITAREKHECARRELSYRQQVFPRRIAKGQMSSALASRQIALMEAIAEDYRILAEQDEREELLL